MARPVSRVTAITIALVFMALTPIAAYKAGKLTSPDSSIVAEDLSLAGYWKISYSDDSRFSSAAIPDEDWCITVLPNPKERLGEKSDGNPSKNCPSETYPRSLMQNSSYWYRKWISIPQDKHWKQPALFLGAVKHRAWIYWDGNVVGRSTYDLAPIIVPLAQVEASPGKHLLAVRVETDTTRFPGLVHAYRRGMALGEIQRAVASVTQEIDRDLVRPMVAFVVQFLALLLLLYFIIRSSESAPDLMWLAFYFGIAATASAATGASSTFSWLIWRLNISWTSLALIGYASHTIKMRDSKNSWDRPLLGVAALILIWQVIALAKSQPDWLWSNHVDVVLAAIAAVVLSIRVLVVWVLPLVRKSKRANPILPTDIAIVAALFYMHLNTLYLQTQGIVFNNRPLLSILLTIVVILSAIESFLYKEQNLKFFGRFLRTGLRDLLTRHTKRAFRGEKILEGRKVVLLKIDIVGHTETTFGMPYGMKRLFQDTWFTIIDGVVDTIAFTDQPEGDGSNYFFAEEGIDKVATRVLEAVGKIEETGIPAFDREFSRKLAELCERNPEFDRAARAYYERYEKKTGHPFLTRTTRAKFALLYGYIDEGLWGMMSRGHYDVQGDLISLGARLEKHAVAGELVCNDGFVEKLRTEGFSFESKYQIQTCEAELKGIGVTKFLRASRKAA